MKFVKIGLAFAGIAWMATIAAVLFWQFAPSGNMFGVETRATANTSGHQAGSIGKRRYLLLVEATRHYSKENSDAAPEIIAGSAFAPVDFLNSELKRRGEKWRVRSTDGLEAEIYEVS